VIKLEELVTILDLHRQGLSVGAIARQVGVDRKTVRAYISRGLEPPVYKKRPSTPGVVDSFAPYLRERLMAYPGLAARRLYREIKERGFSGGYSVVRDRVRDLRPARSVGHEVRFKTPPASRRKSISPGSRSRSPTSRQPRASSGCSRWCPAAPG
jgi:transposase